jgi:hypothetical protein
MTLLLEAQRALPPHRGRGRSLGWALVLLASAAVAGGEEAGAAAEGNRRTVVIAPQYKASGFHDWLWGSDYRPLWTTPISVEVLDLKSFAGGLTAAFRVGGQETKGLALKGNDGRDYTFRAIDKDPTSVLPEELRDTWVRNLVQDQIAADHPASFFVVDELMKAAGVPRTEQRLVVMPDDPALGDFRKDFAGLVGQMYEFPGAKSDKNPGFQGATEILRHEAFWKRKDADPKDRADARALLKARLLDIMIGDWDRHRDQWRWAKLPGKEEWQPIPDDRDQAFSRYEGLVLDLARPRAFFLQDYNARYPGGFKGLVWNGREQDRELLSGLELPVWKEVAAELQSAMTDEVIERAAHRMPPEYFKIDGERLIRDLKGRRDRLPEGAAAFYAHIADKVKVYLTDVPEYVEVKRLEGGDTLVQVFRLGTNGQPTGEPYYRRTLHSRETDEVQIYLRGGNDRVVTLGRGNDIEVRVIGANGHDVVDDTNGGGTKFYDTGRGELLKGPGSSLDRKAFDPPPPPKNAPWIPPRDWGRNTFGLAWLAYGSDLGVFVGAGFDTQSFGFRKKPYASRHIVRAGWAFGDSTFRADYKAEFRFENKGWYAGWYAYASGIESSRYFGFGNETSDLGDQGSDFFKAKQQQYSLSPALAFPVGKLTFFVGPSVKYASNTHKDEATLVNEEQPYGFGNFGEVGATGGLELDTRVAASPTPGGVALRSVGYARSGALVRVRGQIWPKAWDVKDTFGSVEGSAAAYLTPGSNKAPTLALRVGGKKVFGDYPYFEAAYLGGGLGGFGALLTAGDGPVRGLQRHRYAGDAAVFGNADLRIYISRFRIFLPGEWGVFGFGDGGRVYLEGENSDQWHYGYGGGPWFAWLDRANTVSFSYARSEGHNAFYVRAGFAF